MQALSPQALQRLPDSPQQAQAFVYDTPSYDEDLGEDHVALDILSQYSEDAGPLKCPVKSAFEEDSKGDNVQSLRVLGSYRSVGYHMARAPSKSKSSEEGSKDEKAEFSSSSPQSYKPSNFRSGSALGSLRSHLSSGQSLSQPSRDSPAGNTSFLELVAQFSERSGPLEPGTESSAGGPPLRIIFKEALVI